MIATVSNRHHPRSALFRRTLIPAVAAFAALMPLCREQPSDSRRNKAAPAADTFTVAFYNVENLFDNEFDGKEYVEYRPNATNWNRQMHRIKFGNIGSVCAAVSADVLALCEVEDTDALSQLQEVLRNMDVRYPYRAINDLPRTANTCTAVLSRFPVKSYRSLSVVLPSEIATRGILEADLDIDGRPLKLFVNHWPSKYHPESYRLAAADRLQGRLGELPKGTDYIVAGDFNSDYDEFATFSTFGLNDTRGVAGLNHRLGTVRILPGGAVRPAGEREAAGGAFPSHYDLWLELPETIRMSYFYKGNRQTPDHILLPPSLYDSSGISYLDNSFASFTWGGRLLSYGKPIRWKMRYSGKRKFHAGEGYSDHLPVYARFITAPFRYERKKGTGQYCPPSDTNTTGAWFELHCDGWVAYENSVRIVRDTVAPVSGRYALHLVAPPEKKNCTVARTVLGPGYRGKNGSIEFSVRGSGKICFRTRGVGEEKWRYFALPGSKASGTAQYNPVFFERWKTVDLKTLVPDTLAIELELRTGKGTPLDVWIDR